MAQHRKSIVKESIDRLEAKMAIGQSRRQAKQDARASGEHPWAFSTGKIHSFKTRSVYQEHILRFITWTRSTHNMKSLAQLDPHASDLASEYLQKHISEGRSPYTAYGNDS